MEADVRQAEAALRLAFKARLPDFAVGAMADAKMSPVLVRPLFTMTLTIWRDKIAATIREAQAMKRSAAARLSAEQIALTVDFAEKTFSFREVSRNLKLLQDQLLPKAKLSLEVARSAYLSNKIEFINLLDAERTLLDFNLSEVEARTQRELVLAELSLVILGMPPANSPILNQPASAAPKSYP